MAKSLLHVGTKKLLGRIAPIMFMASLVLAVLVIVVAFRSIQNAFQNALSAPVENEAIAELPTINQEQLNRFEPRLDPLLRAYWEEQARSQSVQFRPE